MTIDLTDFDLSTIPDRAAGEDEIAGVIVVRTDAFENIDHDPGPELQAAAAAYVEQLATILQTTPDRIHMVSRITDVQVSLVSGSGADIIAGTVEGDDGGPIAGGGEPDPG